MIRTTRFRHIAVFALVAMLALGLLTGCTRPGEATDAAGSATSAEKPIAIRIGTLATEESLPLWVAETMGYFATQGIPSVEIVSFQSVEERDAAFASGAVNAFMGDIAASANLEAGGKKNSIVTIIPDDTTTASNLPQTVLIVSDEYLAKTGGSATKDGVLAAWDLAVNDINKAPDAYRDLLVQKANMPESLATTYTIRALPTAQLPTSERVDAFLGLMRTQGKLKGDVTAADLLPALK